MEHTLPALPYANTALAPYYSQETFEYHHAKHHNAYVVNLNNLQKGTEFESMGSATRWSEGAVGCSSRRLFGGSTGMLGGEDPGS